MGIKKNRLAIVFLALFATTVLAACAATAASTPTPAPTATPTPEPVRSIAIDPQVDPNGFLAALPAGEVDCASSVIGGSDTLTKLITLSEDATAGIDDTRLKVLASCFSDDTVQKVVVGQLELETGGLSAATTDCVRSYTAGIDFASLFSGQVVEEDTIVSTLQSLFCLSSRERKALEASDQEIIRITQLGGIDALECAVDGAGPNGLTEFGDIFGTDGTVDTAAVGRFMPLLIDCGVIEDAEITSSPFSADQFSCLFEHIDLETLNEFLSVAGTPGTTPDLGSAAELISAMTECGLDLQTLIENSEPTTVDPPVTGSTGEPVFSTDVLLCLTENGVSSSLAASYAAGLVDASDPDVASALAACEGGSTGSGGGTGSGIVVPDGSGGSTTIDSTFLDALPVTPEQAQCLIDEVGLDQLEGIAAGTSSPLTIIGALGVCKISISDLLAG